MKFIETGLAGCFIAEIEPIGDERGYFARTFCAGTFAENGLNPVLAQASISFNRRKGTLRGLHFQAEPAMEDKLVRCSSGALFDVAVDLRPASPTFAKWIGIELTPDNGRQLYIPQGFAHGFQTLADATTIAYHIAQAYEPERSAGVVWNDPEIGVRWPLPPTAQSPRDLHRMSLETPVRSSRQGGASSSRHASGTPVARHPRPQNRCQITGKESPA
jgi:dTDP-4-dehydrorhamnose 3,5-epimerase